MNGLAKKTKGAVLWNVLERFATQGIIIITTLLFAWFLTPEDYAIVAMMAVFISLSNALVDAGLSQALLRLPNFERIDLNTIFFTNLGLSVLVYGLCYFSASHIAEFYSEPRLIELIRVVCLGVFFQGVTVIQKTLLAKKLNFKTQVKVVLPASLFSSCVAVIIAFLGYGVWALIYQMLVMQVMLAIFYWRLQLWRPKAEYSITSLQRLMGFSSFILLDSIVAIPFNNMYLMVLPKFFTVSTVGFYYFAQKIKEFLLNFIVGSIQTVTYPALSQLKENNQRLKAGYRKVLRVTTYILFPVLLFTAGLANVIFEVFLPVKWHNSAVYLQLMLLASVLYPLHAINLNILKVKGRSDLYFYIGLYKKFVAIAVFVVTVPFGILAVLIGQIVVSIINYLPNFYYASRLIHYSILEQLVDFLPTLVLAIFIAIGVFIAQVYIDINPISELLLLSTSAAFLFIMLSLLFNIRAFNEFKKILFSYKSTILK